MPNLVGQVLLDQYKVDAFVASGGMGAVYRVWDRKRNVPLAMKVLHSELAEDPHMFKRFKREANALKKLTHPNIVSFYGLFQTSGLAFLLERYVDGPSLKDILRQKKQSPTQSDLFQSLVLGFRICPQWRSSLRCEAGQRADRSGRERLSADFGLLARGGTTTHGDCRDSPYMAPEQIRGDAVTPATGVCLEYALRDADRRVRFEERTQGQRKVAILRMSVFVMLICIYPLQTRKVSIHPYHTTWHKRFKNPSIRMPQGVTSLHGNCSRLYM
jgi:serine/threonine protein kinase